MVFVLLNLYLSIVEAMKAKLLAPLDDPEMTVLEEAVFDWDIDNWRDLPKKIYSKPYTLGGYDWKFYLFPEGNNTPNVSIYLATEPTKSKKKTDAEESSSDTNNNEDSDWAVCCLSAWSCLILTTPPYAYQTLQTTASQKTKAIGDSPVFATFENYLFL